MPTVRLVVSTSEKLAPLVSAALFSAGALGLEERPGPSTQLTQLILYAETRESIRALWRRAERSLKATLPTRNLPTATIGVDEAEAWRTAWMEHLRPVQLTRRLVLAPAHVETPPLSPAQRLIVYQPALAFGDGDHATTRLAARAIEAHYKQAPGGALLDIGSGTGVLAFVAVLSGARRALGTDIDAQALQAARTNAALNGLTKQTRFVPSSARISAGFDLVVINIELRPLLQVLAKLPAAARRAPKLLVTGFLKSQLPEVQSAVKAAGFAVKSRRSETEWCLLQAVNQ
jgi:ribosomal protein L11 methyltransferase